MSWSFFLSHGCFYQCELSVFLYILSVCVCAEAYAAQGHRGICPWRRKTKRAYASSINIPLINSMSLTLKKALIGGIDIKVYLPPLCFCAPDKTLLPLLNSLKNLIWKILDTPLCMCLSICVRLWIAKTFLTKFCVAVIYCLWIFGVFVQI